MYPYGFLANLDKHYSDSSKLTNKKICSQQISDVLLFKCHSDPQLRGAVRTLTANFIKAVLVLSEGDYGKWILDNVGIGRTINFSITELIQIFIEVNLRILHCLLFIMNIFRVSKMNQQTAFVRHY